MTTEVEHMPTAQKADELFFLFRKCRQLNQYLTQMLELGTKAGTKSMDTLVLCLSRAANNIPESIFPVPSTACLYIFTMFFRDVLSLSYECIHDAWRIA